MTASATAFRPGDRAPEVYQPAPDGRVSTLYEQWCGRPLILAVFPDPADAAAQSVLTVLATRFAPRPGVGLAAVAPPAKAQDLPTGVAPVLDEGALIQALLGPAAQGAVFVFDATLRLRVALDPGDDLEQAVEDALAMPPRTQAPAPVLLVPDVLDAPTCHALMDAWGAENAESGMVRLGPDGQPTLIPDPSAKRRRDHMLKDPDLQGTVVAALQRRLLPEIAKAFAFRVTRYEPLKVVAYDAASGGYFRLHRDNTSPDVAHRAFAMTLCLNDAYQGGELRFPEYGPQTYRPHAGGAIVFACAHLHELTDVTAGRRFALLTFF